MRHGALMHRWVPILLATVAWLACGTSAAQAEAPRPTPAAAASSAFFDVGGSNLYYEQCGSGPAVVLLHDGLLHSITWDDSWAPLCRKFHVIRYDRRGYGRSDPPTRRFSQAEDLYALLTHLKVRRAVIVGNSSGGALAIDFALSHPEMVEGLLLVGPVVHGMGVTEQFRKRGSQNMVPLNADGSGAAATAENWSRDPYLIAPGHEDARKKLRDGLAQNPQNLRYTGDLELRNAPPAVDRLSEIRAPTLILVGEFDIPDVQAHGGIIEAGIPGASREVVAGAGHLIQLDSPEVFVRKTAWYVDRLEKPEADIPVTLLDDYVGEYDLGGGDVMTIMRVDRRLIGHVPGQLLFHIFPDSETKFFFKTEATQIEFRRDAAGKVSEAVIDEDGTITHAPRR